MTLGSIPIDLSKLNKKNLEKQILRIGMLAELDAINLYEQLADMTENNNLKKLFLEIAKEEKTHLGEFEYLLLKLDQQQKHELDEGAKEVKELIKD